MDGIVSLKVSNLKSNLQSKRVIYVSSSVWKHLHKFDIKTN